MGSGHEGTGRSGRVRSAVRKVAASVVSPAGAGPGRRRLAIAAAVLLAAALAAAYAPALRADFTNFDDDEFVTRNPSLRGGFSLAAVRWAFTTFHAGNWIPLTWLSHLLDVSLFGMQPWGHHLVSVLLHGANTLLCFFVLRSMTGAFGRSLFVAALFGLHPLHVESVAWVAERKDVLSTLFFFLALGAHQRYARRPTTGRYLATAAAVACGLLAKPMVVTLPVVLLLADVWPLGRLRAAARPGSRSVGALLLEKGPLLALVCAAGAITFAAQSHRGTVAGLEAYPLAMRLFHVPVSYLGYLGKMVWPANLGPYYPFPVGGPSAARAGIALLPLLLVGVFALRVRAKQPWHAIGWLWYLATLVPVIGLVQVGTQALADRYTYVPLLGPFIMISWGAFHAVRIARPVLLGIPAALVLSVFAVLTHAQAGYWRDSVSLMTRAIQVAAGADAKALPPDAWVIFGNLGNAYSERGEHAQAVGAYHRALAVNPRAAAGYYALGNAYSSLGRLPEATRMYRKAVELRPAFTDAWYNLGNISLLLGLTEESRQAFERAAQLEASGDPAR